MINLIDNDEFTEPVRGISDGDPANAAFTNAGPQDLANRTRFLYNEIKEGGLTRDGATRIREVADEAALRALVGIGDGELAITKDKGLVFRHVATAGPIAEQERWVVKSGSGPGAWINTAFGLVGGPHGLVAADSMGLSSTPARRPREVADLDELRGIGRAARREGDVCFVPLLGFYRYSDTYPGSNFGIWAVKSDEPSEAHPGYGAWRHTLYGAITADGGLMVRDENNRLPAGMPKNGVVQMPFVTRNAGWSSAGDAMSSTGLELTIDDLLPGDIVDLDAVLNTSLDGAIEGNLRFRFEPQNGTTEDVPRTRANILTGGSVALAARFEVPASPSVSSYTFSVWGQRGGTSGSLTVAGNSILRATVYRP